MRPPLDPFLKDNMRHDGMVNKMKVDQTRQKKIQETRVVSWIELMDGWVPTYILGRSALA